MEKGSLPGSAAYRFHFAGREVVFVDCIRKIIQIIGSNDFTLTLSQKKGMMKSPNAAVKLNTSQLRGLFLFLHWE